AHGQLEYYRSLASGGHLRIITSRHELAAHHLQWQAWAGSPGGGAAGVDRSAGGAGPVASGSPASGAPVPGPPIGAVLLMECADPLPSPESIVAWVQAGVRAVGPAHYGPNVYAHGTGAPGGLTQGGRRLLQLMDALGVVLDTSHLS